MGFGVWGLGFGVWGLGFGVWGLGFGVWGLGFGVWGLEFGVWSLRFGHLALWGRLLASVWPLLAGGGCGDAGTKMAGYSNIKLVLIGDLMYFYE